MAKDEWFESD